MYIHIYIHTHTHTHTHIYIYVYILYLSPFGAVCAVCTFLNSYILIFILSKNQICFAYHIYKLFTIYVCMYNIYIYILYTYIYIYYIYINRYVYLVYENTYGECKTTQVSLYLFSLLELI